MSSHLTSFCLSVLLCTTLAACVQPPTTPTGLLDVAERPAEKALLAGIRAYDDAQYPQAEKHLQAALQAGAVTGGLLTLDADYVRRPDVAVRTGLHVTHLT